MKINVLYYIRNEEFVCTLSCIYCSMNAHLRGNYMFIIFITQLQEVQLRNLFCLKLSFVLHAIVKYFMGFRLGLSKCLWSKSKLVTGAAVITMPGSWYDHVVALYKQTNPVSLQIVKKCLLSCTLMSFNFELIEHIQV